MGEDLNQKNGSEEERKRVEAEAAAQMKRTRMNDYVAIILALTTIFLLWLLQRMGLY